MPTRRTVLKGTALSLIGSVLPISVMAKQVLSVSVKVVYEDGIMESIAFKDALKHRVSGIYALKQDPAETFRELSGPGHTETMILGCTKGAAAFVLGELARGQGGKMLIYGEHRYLPGAEVQHSLQLHDAGTQMISRANNWSKAMASALDTGLFHAAPAKKQVITTTMSRPVSSPDYLVTWCFTCNLFKQVIRQPSPPLSQVL